MAWAKANGKYEGENPVDIASGGLPDNRSEVPNHHPALPYDDLPGVMRALAAQDSISGLALRFIILTTVRSGEARGARREIDLDVSFQQVVHPARTEGADEDTARSQSAAKRGGACGPRRSPRS